MLERRLQNRVCQLQLATRPDGTGDGGPDRATADPGAVNEISEMYGSPEEIVQRLGTIPTPEQGAVNCSTNPRISKSWRNSHGPDYRDAKFLCV